MAAFRSVESATDTGNASDLKRRKSEEGSATISSLAVILVILLLVVGLLGFVVVQRTKVQVQAGVDLAALAGASDSPSALLLEEAKIPCNLATLVGVKNGITVDECWISDADLRVVGGKTVKWMGFPIEVKARARAGSTFN